MTRTNAREIAMHLCFELSFQNSDADALLDSALTRQTFETIGQEEPLYSEFPNVAQKEYIRTLVRGVSQHDAELDDYIARYAIGWDFARLPRVAVAIMRLAMYEILYVQDVPNAAAINEAVEMMKRYDEPEVVSFINGILGTFVRSECLPDLVGDPKAASSLWE